MVHTNGVIQYVIFCVWIFFTLPNDFILWPIKSTVCIFIHILFIHVSIDKYLSISIFQVLSLVLECMIWYNILFEYCFKILELYTKEWNLESYDNFKFGFWGNTKLFFIVSIQDYTVTSSYEGPILASCSKLPNTCNLKEQKLFDLWLQNI